MDSPSAQGPSSARALLRWQFRIAHELLEAAIEPLATEGVYRYPTGTVASAGACYAQVVLCEDLSVNGVLSAGAPLAHSIWAGRTGLSEMPSLTDPTDWRPWGQRVQLDFGKLRLYARAVYASTDSYLAVLRDDVVDQPRDETPLYVLNGLLLTLLMRRGQIACLRAAAVNSEIICE